MACGSFPTNEELLSRLKSYVLEADVTALYDPLPVSGVSLELQGLVQRAERDVLRITGISASYLGQDALIAELQAENGRLRTEVESLRVEKRYLEARLERLGHDFGILHTTVRSVSGFQHVATAPKEFGAITGLELRGADIVAHTASGNDFVITGAMVKAALNPEPATHAKPFPARAMR